MTITRDVDGGISVLTVDDGKVNAFDVGRFAELDAALDDCADDAAVVLCGREGVFSAGLDRAVLSASRDELLALAIALTRTTMRLWTEPRPVVAAVTGHAIAAGTILALACDHAIAAQGDYRWGLNETAIGLVLPQWVIALARSNVRADRLDGLILPGRLVTVDEALEVGFADEVAAADAVRDRAIAHATSLTQLSRETYAANKWRLRGAAADAAVRELDEHPPVLRP